MTRFRYPVPGSAVFPTFLAESTGGGSDDGTFQMSLVGRTVDRYLVVDEIGAGGMGVVYKAYDPDLGRLVALKLVHAGASSRAAIRLQREARSIARLSHPNVVAVYDAGQHGDEVYIVMELVEGQRLREWLSVGVRPQREILDIFLQAARGLAAAHDGALVHRDFKPDNVLVGDDGRVRVVDFGLARAARADDDSEDLSNPFDDDPSELSTDLERSITPTGAAVGTPRYMSPEQHAGNPVDARADQFAWGVALYEALTRQRPYEGYAKELRKAVMSEPPRPVPDNAGVPDWLVRLVMRTLATAPEARFASMHVVVAEMTRDRSVLRRTALNGSASTEPLVAAFPPPDQAAARVHRLRLRLEEAWRKKTRGALVSAMSLAREISDEARKLEYPPLYAAALYLVGNLEHRTGDSLAARQTLHAAAREAAAVGDDWQVANVWIFLVLVLGVGLGRTEEALTIADVAEVALQRVGDNASLRSRLCGYRGAALAEGGRAVEAADACAQAVSLDEATHGPGHTFLVVSLLNLAEVWLDGGCPERAQGPLERARDICRPDETPPTSSRMRWLGLWARLLLDQGDAAAARAAIERAIAVWERQPGRERTLAGGLVTVAGCLRSTGDRDGARAMLDRVAELADASRDRRLTARIERELAALDAAP